MVVGQIERIRALLSLSPFVKVPFSIICLLCSLIMLDEERIKYLFACDLFHYRRFFFFLFSLNLCLIVNAVHHFCSQQDVFTLSLRSTTSQTPHMLCDAAAVREFMVVSFITFRHQLAWTCTPCSQTSLSLVHAARWFERAVTRLLRFAIPCSSKQQVRQSQPVTVMRR